MAFKRIPNSSSFTPIIYKTAAPLVTDINYFVPSIWVDTVGKKTYILNDVTLGVATWVELGVGSSGGVGTVFSNLDVDTGTETVDAFADTDGNGAVWQYSLKKSTDIRTGQIIATWDPVGNTVEFSELRTPDIGDTSGVTFSVDIDSNIVRLRCTVNSDNWGVTGYRFLF